MRDAKHNGMVADHQPPSFQLNDYSAFYSVTSCAGVIAHDPIHSKLYRDYRVRHESKVPGLGLDRPSSGTRLPGKSTA
jgi:hypothetical protein